MFCDETIANSTDGLDLNINNLIEKVKLKGDIYEGISCCTYNRLKWSK
ncbi:hypothetical protein QJS64_17430 [Paraclostridium bifermentans]|uniref:Uncharacterized protein n=1 Tax=Paraclostridium bifermentans TaxID=1490 RepID=A0ABY8R3V7_PARBF|nr:hypothetical protein QJS64_17430 [Paraclostridium bifermentans]